MYDIETHFTQTWQAMETMVEKGLVKAIGVSNFNEDQLQILINNCKVSGVVWKRRLIDYTTAELPSLVSICSLSVGIWLPPRSVPFYFYFNGTESKGGVIKP